MAEPSILLLSYRTNSKGSKKRSLKIRLWLRLQMLKVWLSLRFKYGCTPLQKPIWLVKKLEKREALEEDIARWENMFRVKGFEFEMELFTTYYSLRARETFKRLKMDFIIQWLSKIDEELDVALKDLKITESSFDLIERRVELLESVLCEDFEKDYDQFERAYSMVMIAYDKLKELSPCIIKTAL